MKERTHFWMGVFLAGAVGIGLSAPAWLAARQGWDSWSLWALGISLGAFLAVYFLIGLRREIEVERLVEQRTAELAEANRKLHELARLKDEFVAQVSHELRTPMAIIREGISQVLEEICGGITQEQRGTLSVTLRNMDRLGRLIEDLLDLSKIEAGKLPLERKEFDLVSLTREITQAFLSRIQERGLNLKTRLPDQRILVSADRDKVTQVFTNLISNALKFTEDGFIEVSIEDGANAVCCSVTDTGPGIEPGQLDRLFQKFEQLVRLQMAGEKGTGLGLAICKGIVELHGGRIWAESAPQRGTRFTFTLPKQKEEVLHAA